MRRTALLVTILLCCTACYAFASVPDQLTTDRAPQPKGLSETPQAITLVGGDTFATATVIGALPYSDGGSTCNFLNDYNPPCVPSTARDVVYSFTPSADACLDISLCGSSYDTEIVVYQNNVGTPVACQDDSPDCGLQSHLPPLNVTAGNTYYIVIDGFGSACGTYSLNVIECPPPPVCDPCPAGAQLEGEPTCFDGYIDNTNGGCNSTPTVYTQIPCDDRTHYVCGTYGTFNAGGTRDTDWYRMTVTAPTTITATVVGEGVSGSAIAILDANADPCNPINILCGDFNPSAACVPRTCSANVGPGSYIIFTASFFGDGTPCGADYVLAIEGNACPTPTAASSWGKVKKIYR